MKNAMERFRHGDWGFIIKPHEYKNETGEFIRDDEHVWFWCNFRSCEKTKKFLAPTNISKEEMKIYSYGDPKHDQTVRLSLQKPYNLYIKLSKVIRQTERKHLVEVGVDLNFQIIVGAIKIDGEMIKEIFIKQPFPMKIILKLHKKENLAQSAGNLPKKSMIQSTASRITKGTYYRYIETIQKYAKKYLKLKRLDKIKFIWYIENPFVLRKMNSQFMKQGWKPTILKLCLEEKAKFIYIGIVERNPAYTSIACNKCYIVHDRKGKEMKCECGEVIDWDENAALNLLNGIEARVCQQCGKPQVRHINKENKSTTKCICGSMIDWEVNKKKKEELNCICQNDDSSN